MWVFFTFHAPSNFNVSGKRFFYVSPPTPKTFFLRFMLRHEMFLLRFMVSGVKRFFYVSACEAQVAIPGPETKARGVFPQSSAWQPTVQGSCQKGPLPFGTRPNKNLWDATSGGVSINAFYGHPPGVTWFGRFFTIWSICHHLVARFAQVSNWTN